MVINEGLKNRGDLKFYVTDGAKMISKEVTKPGIGCDKWAYVSFSFGVSDFIHSNK